MGTDAGETAAPRRQGRRPGTNDSRQAILDAARARFATDGFASTTIRKIAADAGVDASLVMQFFGSKDELFRSVMAISPSALARMSDAFEGPSELLGERVTRAFLDLWDGDPVYSEPLLAMLRAAISNEHATNQLRDIIQTRLVEDLAPHIADDKDARTRIEVVSSMLVGVVVGRRIVKVDALVGENRENLVALVSPAIQSVLVGASTI